MGIAKLYGQKASGTNINGIIKDYHAYAGENISAGDLVEYINGIASQRTETSNDIQLSSESSSASDISAVQLDENRVFIAHSCKSYYGLYGIVVTIDGATITAGTDTALDTNSYSGSYISAVALDSGRVFIAHSYTSNFHLYSMVVTISGTNVTIGTDTALVSSSSSATAISTQLLSSGNVFVAHSYGSSCYLYAIVCTISGTTITKGTDTKLQGSNIAGGTISSQLLPSGNIFVAHSLTSSYSLYALVCSVSGTTISASGSSTQMITSTNSGAVISTELLPNGTVLVVHSDSSDMMLYGFVCTIEGTTPSRKGTDYLISSTYKTGKEISTQLLPNGKVFIAHSHTSGSYYLYGIIATIDGNTVTVGTDTKLNANSYSGYTISSILLPNGAIFIAHSYSTNYYFYAQVFGIDEANNVPTNNVAITEYETQVRKTTTSRFDGVAKTSGVGGTTTVPKDYVSVYTLEPKIENLLLNADFSDGINNWTSSISQISPTIIEENGEKILVNTVISIVSYSGYYRGGSYQSFNQPSGEHIYYASIYYKGKSTNTSTDGVRLAMGSASSTNKMSEALSSTQNDWKLLSMYGSFGDSSKFGLYGDTGKTATVGDQYFYKQPKLYDLTAFFGAGNEPTQKWCDENL